MNTIEIFFTDLELLLELMIYPPLAGGHVIANQFIEQITESLVKLF